MKELDTCPICLERYKKNGVRFDPVNFDGARIHCEYCGTFDISRSAQITAYRSLDESDRRKASHFIAKTQGFPAASIPMIKVDWLVDRLPTLSLPPIGASADNFLSLVGQRIQEFAQEIEVLPLTFYPASGFADPLIGKRIIADLISEGYLVGSVGVGYSNSMVCKVQLTLKGWRHFEEISAGETTSNYIFLALAFSNTDLSNLKRNVIRPALLDRFGLEVFDMRDLARSGVIDNVMREQISRCRILISDLTDDNFGSYWEAGFAEGFGKPVIYICNKGKWDAQQTHFDTNHMTTILWGGEKSDLEFVDELCATISRSLDYFAV